MSNFPTTPIPYKLPSDAGVAAALQPAVNAALAINPAASREALQLGEGDAGNGLVINGIEGLTFLPLQNAIPGSNDRKFYGPADFTFDVNDTRAVCYWDGVTYILAPNFSDVSNNFSYYSSPTLESDDWTPSALSDTPTTSLNFVDPAVSGVGGEITSESVLTALQAMDGTQEAQARRSIGVVSSSGRGTGKSRILSFDNPDFYAGVTTLVPGNLTAANDSNTHPSVLHFDEPWNGYHYWMANTPWPNTDAEEPCIFASNNGEDWVVPAGLTNPIYRLDRPRVGANGTFMADTELVRIGNTLYCWFLVGGITGGGASTKAIRLESTDGITWGNKQLQDYNCHTLDYDETTGILTSWYPDQTPAPAVIYKRTSDDSGLTWSEPVTCVLPGGNIDIWHFSVRRSQGVYHMLAHMDESSSGQYLSRLFYLTSTDGITWEGKSMQPLPLLIPGYYGNYRSDFIPKIGPGGGLVADIYATQTRNYNGIPTQESQCWKIALFRDFNLSWDDRPEPWKKVFAIMRNTMDFPLMSTMWDVAGTGGTIASDGSQLRMNTGAAANNASVATPKYNPEYQAYPYMGHGVDRLAVDNRLPIVISFSLCTRPAWSATMRAMLLFPVQGGQVTTIPSTGSPPAFPCWGIRIDNGLLYVIAFDGTTFSETSTGLTLSGYLIYHFHLEKSGNQIALYVNGVLRGYYPGAAYKANVAGQPWNSRSYHMLPCVGIENGNGGGDKVLLIGKLMVSQSPSYLNP